MNVGILGDKRAIVRLRFRAQIFDYKTNQDSQAVEVGQNRRCFIPQGWGNLRARNSALMLSSSGRRI
jgi:hypothetical protein